MRYRIACLVLSGCSVTAYTPPARPMPLSPAQIPATGDWDAQVDGNTSGSVMGPGLWAGNLRYRRGVADHVAIVGDVGYARAHFESDSQLDPSAGTSRVGVQVSGAATDEIDAAAFTGVGGGYAPAAGDWVSFDAGGMITGTHKYIRPVIALDGFVSEPFATKLFQVNDTMLRLPRTYGVQGLAGFDLGPRDRAVMVGLAVARLYAAANDVQGAIADTFIGLGGGFRFAE